MTFVVETRQRHAPADGRAREWSATCRTRSASAAMHVMRGLARRWDARVVRSDGTLVAAICEVTS